MVRDYERLNEGINAAYSRQASKQRLNKDTVRAYLPQGLLTFPKLESPSLSKPRFKPSHHNQSGNQVSRHIPPPFRISPRCGGWFGHGLGMGLGRSRVLLSAPVSPVGQFATLRHGGERRMRDQRKKNQAYGSLDLVSSMLCRRNRNPNSRKNRGLGITISNILRRHQRQKDSETEQSREMTKKERQEEKKRDTKETTTDQILVAGSALTLIWKIWRSCSSC